MVKIITPDLVLGPIFDDLLTPESAGRVAAYMFPPDVVRRLETLREKAGEDGLTPAERREYADAIDLIDLIDTLKSKARRLLAASVPAGV